jgi:stage II sporulation protein D
VGGLPETVSIEPTIRVGVLVGESRLVLGGGSALLLTGGDGGGLIEVPTGSTAEIVGGGSSVQARIGGVLTSAASALTVRAIDSSGFVRVAGREYRGDLLVSPRPGGLLAVNLVSLESYVAGVVNAEMGRRPPGDSEAVYAQAVISRTVAMRSLGRYRVRGYDLLSTVADQAYGGVPSETEMGWAAVRATHGQVLTADGAVIEAFFHSTCGGRTESVDQVFTGAPQPYLRSVSDRDPTGQAYCSISPRFRWHEEWSAETLGRTLSVNARLGGLAADGLLEPADLQIASRSAAGRADELVVVAGGRAQSIRGQQTIRQVLRTADGGWLRSAQFTLQVTRSGGRIVRVVADGGGAGHGVGMCQWGAVGRARAGFDYRAILAAYFPGTEISRLF